MSFFLYIVAAAWQDGRRKSVSGWLFLFFFSHFLVTRICQKAAVVDMGKFPASFWYHGMLVNARSGVLGMGCLLGGILLLIGRLSRGALGEGDGIFFIIAGIYLGFWKNLALLVSALILCSFSGLVLFLWGQMQGRDYRKKTLPLLVFTLPMGIYLTWL